MPDIVDRDEQAVSHEDDELRHVYLDDATVLLDDREVRVIDASEPDNLEWNQIMRRAHRAVPYARRNRG